MLRFTAVSTVLALLTSDLALANEYHSEITASHSRTKMTSNFYKEKGQNSSLGGAYYFAAVDPTNKPLGEAAFLGKHSYLNLSYTDHRSKLDFGDGDSFKSEGDLKSIGAFVYVPSTILVVGAQYYGSQYYSAQYYSAQKGSSVMYTLGVAPLEGLLVYAKYWDNDNYGRKTNINAKYVMPMADSTAIAVEFGFVKGEDGQSNTYAVSGDYYFNSKYSLGASVYDDGGLSYGLNSRYFFNETLSIYGAVSKASPGDIGLETKNITFGASVRF